MSLDSSRVHASRRYLRAAITLAFAASLLACNDEQDAADAVMDDVDTPSPAVSKEEVVLRPSICEIVLCKAGTQCDPKTGRCEPRADGGLVKPDFGACGTNQPCPAGTYCQTVACTNSIPPNCFGVCAKR